MNNEQNTVEMCLCINGTAEALINGERYDLQQGSLYLISPIVHVFLLRHSEDFALSTIVSSTDNLFPAIEPMYDAMIKNNLYQHPCTMLDRTRQLNFLAMEKRIRQKKEEMQTEPKEEVRKLMLTPINSETTPREPYDGYLIYQGGVPEVEEFVHKVHK